MKILTIFVITIILISCSSKNEDMLQKIKHWEYSRNPDTTFYAGLISTSDDLTKLEIIKSIGKMGQESYVPVLQQLLKSPKSYLITEIIFSFGQIGTAQCEKILIELFTLAQYSEYKKDIVLALGRCANKAGSSMLLKNLYSFNDSLKALTIQNLAYIYKRDPKLKTIADTVNQYLNYQSQVVKNAAIYFFNRNLFKPSLYNLINSSAPISSIAYKNKLSALSKILNKSTPDTLMLDSLKTVLINKPFYTDADWKKLIYKIQILGYYPDSSMTQRIASFLKNESPHVRISSINTLGKIESEYAKNLLLQYYDTTNWNEKGIIILNLAKRYPKFIYVLIQQNLDQGALYFKELMLQSLAKINDRMSRAQLKQFLNVPEPRLQATAFNELDKLKRLSYAEVRDFLLSKNEMLSSYATYWIGEHPGYGKLDDLITAYSNFREPQHSETMVNILDAINKINKKQSIAFLDSVYLNTQNHDIAKTAAAGLAQFEIVPPKKQFSGNTLFIPDSIIYETEPISITIITEKGDIQIDLYPDDSPLTVSHFIHLIKNGYYKKQIFHRVVSDFVIQGGDPTGTGWGGPGYAIPCEYNNKSFLRGSVGLATAGKDTGGSQFFICHSEQPHLNRRYTNFGMVINGMDVVDQITKDDKIINIVLN